MKIVKMLKAVLTILAIGIVSNLSAAPVLAAQDIITPDEARLLAKEAYIYGFPLVDSYRILYKDVVEQEKGFNTILNFGRVFTPADVNMQTPNSDTPYSFLYLDLRTEPVVLTVPKIEQGRYFSVQLIDAYTFNFDYIGSRTTGNDGGSYLVAGPNWQGTIPPGIKKVFRSETELAMALYRTQLFNPGDIANVQKIQAAYQVQTLSAFLGQPTPKTILPLEFVAALTPAEERKSLAFFNVLNFVLRFCPPHPAESEMMQRFAKIGIGNGLIFAPEELSPELKQAIAAGMADAILELNKFIQEELVTGKVKSSDLFGTRAYMHNNYLYRCAAAITGIYGNSAQEAIYPAYRKDSDGQQLDAEQYDYFLRIPPGQLPPVNAFWSLTMYELPSRLLAENPLHRYLINSAMLPSLQRDADGGITIYIQHNSPGAAKEANWLPAPSGQFWCAMRLYWPQEEALNGSWLLPTLQKLSVRTDTSAQELEKGP